MNETMRDKMIAITDKYCEAHGIKREDLFSKAKTPNAKKKKVINGVNVSTMRMALGYYLSNRFPASLTEIALIIGYTDHSTISYNNQRIYFYIKNQDAYFMQYYNVLEEIGKMYEQIKFVRIRNKAIYA